MDITAAIDVAVGLVLMYLVLSLFCTSINELLAGIFRIRANTLADTLQKLIDDPKIKDAFDKHGLIDTSKIATSKGKATTTAAEAAAAPPAPWYRRLFTNAAPTYLSSRNVALALVGALDPKTPVTTMDQAKTLIAALPVGTNIKDVLDTALLEAGADFDKFRNCLAGWFDDSMDRVSGAYKRHMQIYSIIVGFAIALAFNADTLHVGSKLWSDRTLSAAFAQSAPSLVTQICANDACAAPNGASGPDVKKAADAAIDGMTSLDNNLHGLPIGWNQSDLPPWYWSALGLLLTTVALAMGAPFWFDVLQKIVNFRLAGDKPPKAGDK